MHTDIWVVQTDGSVKIVWTAANGRRSWDLLLGSAA